MAGIYVHIPFCRHKCGYCNFFSVVSLKRKQAFLLALHKELEMMAPRFATEPITTLYVGGGTPSMLGVHELEALMLALQRSFPQADLTEVTLEANPDDVTPNNLSAWIAMGFNRISLGIQSFHTNDLTYLDRRHNPYTALQALELVAAAPLKSFSVDLIYAIPGQSPEQFAANLERCATYGVPHLSCYSLTVEAGTPLDLNIRKKGKQAPDEALFLAHWNILTAFAASHGYEHYETSNLCRGGHFAEHNLSYWSHVPYLGLGPSAHSFLGNQRWWNPSSVTEYIQAMEVGQNPAQEETLTDADLANEHIMTRLRTQWGIRCTEFGERYGPERLKALLELSAPQLQRGWLELTHDHLMITPAGKPLEDHLMALLFSEPPAS
jgi:oxygen-independent coproporphyrinogen III oxidase